MSIPGDVDDPKLLLSALQELDYACLPGDFPIPLAPVLLLEGRAQIDDSSFVEPLKAPR